MLKYLIPSILLFSAISPVSANSPSIGFARSSGEFRVDGAAVGGNATVFEGNVVETSAARAIIQLGQTQMTLAPDSRARVYQDHIVLERGSDSVKDALHQRLEAGSMRVVPIARETVVQIEITSPTRIVVSAQDGG